MAHVIIYVYYNGEWKENEGSYEWSAKNQEVIPMFVKDFSINFEEFMKKLYKKVGMDK